MNSQKTIINHTDNPKDLKVLLPRKIKFTKTKQEVQDFSVVIKGKL